MFLILVQIFDKRRPFTEKLLSIHTNGRTGRDQILLWTALTLKIRIGSTTHTVIIFYQIWSHKLVKVTSIKLTLNKGSKFCISE